MVASAVAPNSRRVCFLFIVVPPWLGAMIYIPTGAAIANWELRDTIPLGKPAAFPRDGNRSVQTHSPSPLGGEGKNPQVLIATTTRPGAGTLSSLRADKSSSSDNLRPAAATCARPWRTPGAQRAPRP